MDNFFILDHLGTIVIISLCAIMFIVALVCVTHKDKAKRSKTDNEDVDLKNFIAELEPSFCEQLVMDPAYSWVDGNIHYVAHENNIV